MMTKLRIARRAVAGMLAVGVTAAAVVMIAGPASAGGFCHEPNTDTAGTQVKMLNHCFTPTVVRVSPGQIVRWTNSDSDIHIVLGAGGAWGDGNDVATGKSYSYRFLRAGVYPYFCMLHPGMIGTVIVGDGKPASVAANPGEAVPLNRVVARSSTSATPDRSAEVAAWMVASAALFVLLLVAGALLIRRRRPASAS